MRIHVATLALLLLGSPATATTPPARNVSPEAPFACLHQQLVVSGLSGDAALVLGGDEHAVLAHTNDGGVSRYWAFSKLGYATLDQPWPRRAGTTRLVFRVVLDGSAHRYAWVLVDGKLQSQASGVSVQGRDERALAFGPPRPLDAAAWEFIDRVVRLKLPAVLASIKEQRAFAAKKHMRFGPANGQAEAYGSCLDLGPAPLGPALDEFVQRQRAEWSKLANAPIDNDRYDLVLRSAHPEWRACRAKADCVVSPGPCGWPDVIARTAESAYASWRKVREEQLNCDMPDEGEKVLAACVAGQCVEDGAVKWNECTRDSDCKVTMTCDVPVAVNVRAGYDGAFARKHWWSTVDGWDHCSNGDMPAPAGAAARCSNGRCELAH